MAPAAFDGAVDEPSPVSADPVASGDGRLMLEVVRGNALGAEIEVREEFLIGRHASGAGTLGADLEISRHHARIARAPDGEYVIEDLASTNGTFVNGTRIAAPHPLADGDSIELGDTTLVAHRAGMAAPAASAAADAIAAEPAVEQLVTDVPTETPAPPPLSLRIDVDFAAGEARVALGDQSDQVRLAYEDGRWRVAPE
jgi:hypothetical protein